jgi:hypothetical protein
MRLRTIITRKNSRLNRFFQISANQYQRNGFVLPSSVSESRIRKILASEFGSYWRDFPSSRVYETLVSKIPMLRDNYRTIHSMNIKSVIEMD